MLSSKLPPPPHEQTWKQWFARFMKIVPYLWPRNSRKLQLLALACLVLLVLGRGVNVLVPQLLGRVVRALGTYDGDSERVSESSRCPIEWRLISLTAPWGYLAAYIVLRLCQGGSGMLAVMQNMLVRRFSSQKTLADLYSVGTRHAIFGPGNVKHVLQSPTGSVLVVPHET